MQLLQIGLALIIVWLIGLTALALYIFKHFRRLSKDVGTGNLITVVDKLIDIEEENSNAVNKLDNKIDELDEKSLEHIQKVGLVKFNPFQELGGDHSFSLALLDGHDDGFVITGLHSRDRTRIYSKAISEGSSKVELSKEESNALKKAMRT